MLENQAPPSIWQTGGMMARTLLRIYGLWIGVCLLGRLALMVWQWGRLADLSPGERLLGLVHGVRMDTMAFGYLLVVPLLVMTVFPGVWKRAASAVVRGWALVVLLLLTYVEVAGFPFFAEYDVRPNILFVEYLKYPKEVVSMLWKDQKLALGVAVVLLGGVAFAFRRLPLVPRLEDRFFASHWRRAVWFLPVAAVLFFGIRSSFGHRPANISDALYSENRVANEIAKNSLHSISDAAYRARKDGEQLAKRYGKIPMEEAYRRVYQLMEIEPNKERPFYRKEPGQRPGVKPKNLVIIVQESMGAQFVEFTGGEKGLTPNLDRLSGEGIAFTNLFSNGTRSIRGLSAMSAGFLPIPGDGVFKRPKSQSGFFSIASLLKPHGYHSSFIYGGEARFDNMKAWYLGNGFEEVIEQKDFKNPSFVSTWGVSDEDLVLRADERYVELSEQGKPFVSVVFSSSNHEPFELPEGKIEWVPGVEKYSVKNAIKYADFAIGRFFEVAKTRAYYEDTVFVVVADHNVRVYGDDEVPVSAFHIPGLILGGGIEPMRHDELASQPEVLATALDLLGLELEHPVLGHSIFNPEKEPFVLMQFNDVYGFRRGDEVAVLRPEMEAETFIYQDGRLKDAPEDDELEKDGLSLLHVIEDLYEEREFK
jgi:phosphoglycerol transferase MdoB-like AlkP superfamily enzyme